MRSLTFSSLVNWLPLSSHTFSSLVNWLTLSSRVFEKSLQYVKRFSRYKNPDAVRQAREYPPTCGLY